MVRYDGDVVAELDMGFLHDGWPERVLEGTFQPAPGDGPLPPEPDGPAAWRAAAEAVLGHPSVASKEPIVRMYDHTVQGMAAVGPFGGTDGDGPNDAAVLAPLLGQPYGMVISHGLNPRLNLFDPYWGGLWAAAEAMSNLVAVGGNPREACLIDNFIWPVPDAESLGGLDRAVDACVDVMQALGIPFVSGKDSLSSTYRYPDGRRPQDPAGAVHLGLRAHPRRRADRHGRPEARREHAGVGGPARPRRHGRLGVPRDAGPARPAAAAGGPTHAGRRRWTPSTPPSPAARCSPATT